MVKRLLIAEQSCNRCIDNGAKKKKKKLNDDDDEQRAEKKKKKKFKNKN